MRFSRLVFFSDPLESEREREREKDVSWGLLHTGWKLETTAELNFIQVDWMESNFPCTG